VGGILLEYHTRKNISVEYNAAILVFRPALV
jgi:hypothetical protein